MTTDPAAPAERPVRIAVVNDYELVVAGIAAVLAPYDDRVTVVELDARMPVVSDVDIVLYDTFGQVQGSHIDVASLVGETAARVVVFSWNDDPDLVAQAFAAGAGGYLSKSIDAEGLVAALERVHAGGQVAPDGVDLPDADGFGRWPGSEHGLSARESEVLALITQGLSNEEVGQRAFIGINTVKTHVRTLYRKIGVTSRSQAVIWGFAHGFDPDRVRRLG